ncbi:MAG: alginate lyase family protein [Pirellulaceae bacterium]
MNKRRRAPMTFAIATLLVGGPLVLAENGSVRRSAGVWTSAKELAVLPTSGPAWQHLKKVADRPTAHPDLSDQNQTNNCDVLAKALVYARTGEPTYREVVIDNCMKAIGTEQGGRALALGRNLAAYVIAADLVGLEVEQDRRFRAWLRDTLSDTLSRRTLRSTHEDRPNNWGTHAGASRAAVAVYLGDRDELARTAAVFKGYLGDRSSYASFKFGDLSWQANREAPVGINPLGAVRDGHLIDGVMPDEMRRGGSFRWPPTRSGYPWEALQGAVVQAEILHRAGYDAWDWEDRALLRAVQCLYRFGWVAQGDDRWIPWLVNFRYGTSLPATSPARRGKTMGWTDWTHARRASQRREYP